ncbi:MAG: hypothetical protein K6U87_09275 [Firmicutes bacterium]|nr:hypothetical protein [Bacillota bacterium]
MSLLQTIVMQFVEARLVPSEGLMRAGCRTKWIDTDWETGDLWRAALQRYVALPSANPCTVDLVRVLYEEGEWKGTGIWTWEAVQEVLAQVTMPVPAPPPPPQVIETHGVSFDLDVYQVVPSSPPPAGEWVAAAWQRAQAWREGWKSVW